MHVTQDVKNRVEREVKRCIGIAEQHYNRTFTMPCIKYNVRGQVAGYAHSSQNTVDFNSTLLMENVDDFIARTVPHEVAHIVDYAVYGLQLRGRKRSVHGPTWKRVMHLFGADPSRCHSYDTSNSQVSRKARFKYQCSVCGEVLNVGPKVHHKIQMGYHYWHTGRGCGKNSKLEFVGTNNPQPIAAQTNKKSKPKGGSTLEKVNDYLSLHQNTFSRQPSKDIIWSLAKDLGIKRTTATTYFYKVRHEHGL